jgi:hypothetical protein
MFARKSYAVAGAAATVGLLTRASFRSFQQELRAAQLRVSTGSCVADTASGPIEYAQQGHGKPMLVVEVSIRDCYSPVASRNVASL